MYHGIESREKTQQINKFPRDGRYPSTHKQTASVCLLHGEDTDAAWKHHTKTLALDVSHYKHPTGGEHSTTAWNIEIANNRVC
jgi:hypothetical protein